MGTSRRGVSSVVLPFGSTQFCPFETRDTPRGKFSTFPTSVTPIVPHSRDPLGYTPYGTCHDLSFVPPARKALPTRRSTPAAHVHARDLDSQPRGRGCRFPRDLDPYP